MAKKRDRRRRPGWPGPERPDQPERPSQPSPDVEPERPGPPLQPSPDVEPEPSERPERPGVPVEPERPSQPRPELDLDPLPERPLADLIVGHDESDAFASLRRSHPLLLLPVRLETRFAGHRLRVRVYPDQIHLDDHRPRLSADEIALGQRFWTSQLEAETNDARVAARRWLAEQLPARRAAWVARQTRPNVAADGSWSFPELQPRQATRAAVAAGLPERWAVIGWVDGVQRFVRFGNAIPDELGFSLALEDASPWTDDAEALPVDAGMAWMIDYDEAVAKGMGVTVDLDAVDDGLYREVRDHGLTLLVVGVSGLGPTAGAAALARLLEAHHYSDGLEFVPQGTSTNNTDAGIAGWTAAVDELDDHFARELDDAAPSAGSNSSARRLGWALGLDADALLTRVLHGDHDEESSARAMNRVLWPATWGRYFDDLLAPVSGSSIVPISTQTKLRSWFVDHVRGGAWLPTLSVGAQPYGVLPVRRSVERKALRDWRDALEWVLLDLRERWRESLPSVPRLDPVVGGMLGGEPEDDIVTILGSAPHPDRFVVRRLSYQREIRLALWDWTWLFLDDPDHELHVLGSWYRSQSGRIHGIESQLEVLRELAERVDDLLPSSLRDDGEVVASALISMAEAHRARQQPIHEYFPGSIDGVFDSGARQANDPKLIWSGYGNATDDRAWTRPLVESEDPEPSDRASTYLARLRARLGSSIEPAPIGEVLGGPNLGRSARASRRSGRTRSLRTARAGAERPARQPSPGSLLERPNGPIAGLPGEHGEGSSTQPPADPPLLYQLIDKVIDDVDVVESSRYRDALELLAATPVDELELRLRETLGLAGHRLDAWLTGFAHERLHELREQAAAGVQLGGFAWVEDLVPDAAGVGESQGFIHAPSLAHAATAAVLRSGWQAHGSSAADSTLAVDLRSDRVRLAAWLLDGIRQGQGLGDLLGCRFERRLHDEHLDRFIDDCRRAVLDSKGLDHEPRGPVDGLDLAELYQSTGIVLTEATLRPGRTYADAGQRGLQAALDELLEGMDAVADASIADSVHHLLQGNTARASATLDAVATGAVPPPGLRGLQTPRPGAGVTHRVMLTLAEPRDAAPSRGSATTPRASFEPELERWVATLLPEPAEVYASVRFDAGSDAPAPLTVTLGDLLAVFELSALDLVYTAPLAEPGAGDAWARRIAALVLAQPQHQAFADRLVVNLAASDTELRSQAISFAELAELAARIRTLLGDARSLDARDLALPGSVAEPGWDLDELEGRVLAAQRRFEAGLEALLAALPPNSDDQARPIGDAPLSSIRAAMLGLDGFELDGVIATAGWVDDETGRAQLYEQAWVLAERAGARLDALASLEASEDDEDDAPRLRRLRRIVAALWGRAFPCLPRFVAPDPATLGSALARSDELLQGDPARATAWLQTLAKVRPGIAALDEVMTLAELLADDSRLRPVVGQLPSNPNEGWAAIAAPEEPGQGRLALFVLDEGGLEALAAARPLAGLVFDAWLEQIPARELATGVALHFDAPSSRPPQALLLLVPPESEAWSFDLVVDSLLETFEAAKLRAVDPDILRAHGHQAPAIFIPGGASAGPQPQASDD